MDEIKKIIKKFLPDLIQARHELHQIPELQYEELKTSALISNYLKTIGYNVQEGAAKTGVVAVLDSGRAGKTIALRADIDALPIQETSDLPYQSRHPGKMHACGHDGHTATLLLVARILWSIKSQLKGKIKLIFQPAEEGGKGALAMIKEGVLENIDAIFGYHNWPGLPLNTIATRPGCILTGSGRFEITISGKKAHLARPQDAINPVTIGASIIKSIEAERIRGMIVNIIGFNSGDWKKGGSDLAVIVGCYFTESTEALDQLKEQISRIVDPHGKVVFHEHCSATVNSKREAEEVLQLARQIEGLEVRTLSSCEYASDDFSEYLKQVHGCYFLVGAGEDSPALHTSSYNFPDQILDSAAFLMTKIVMTLCS